MIHEPNYLSYAPRPIYMTYNLTRMVYGFSYVCIIKDYFGNTFFFGKMEIH